MITKRPRNNDNDGYFDLKLKDRDGNSFLMTVGGNGDLYWIPENHKLNRIFYIDKNDEIGFSVFKQLFDAVGKVDDKYRPVLNGDKITFISEEWHEDVSNILKITNSDDLITIEFVKNENEDAWGMIHRGCNICFCNSGSRVPRVESLFMRMFNHLAYHCDLIPTETLDEENTIR